MNRDSIFCIIVTYKPDPAQLGLVIDSIEKQNSKIIVIDNTPDPPTPFPASKNVEFIRLKKNVGIAKAQNIGIKKALSLGAKLIWLSDQDTIYPEEFLEKMLNALEYCQTKQIQLAAISPAYFDTHKGFTQPFVRHAPFTQFFNPKPGVHPVAHAIASGTLIPAEVLRTVGLMQEDFFIDWVDLEWCWRARTLHGYQTMCTGDVIIQHTMGDGSVELFRKKISIRSPLRHYYMIRNAIHIALHSKSAKTPIRIEIFAKAIAWTFLFPAISPQEKSQHLYATLTGFLDGLLNRMGEKRFN